ncbi:GmrSD restriction endonuclease domain-containing protein [Endozoicomonas acroporae]|uniref:GmrSD restriction endonuclease domain-containing protein n=1 Tax=Endozoicomonas acroporae TaxID=1701104 RepID=UPI003D7B9FF3
MKNKTESIRKMVTYLNNEEKEGGFWLPNIQRPFVWHEEQIERLFDSIMRQYPISTLLVWRTKSAIRRRKFIDNYNTGLKLSDFYVPEDEKQKLLVLDGQQRLQSLFIGLKGSYDKKELYFNILSGDLASPDEIRYQFKFMMAERAAFPWIKFKDLVFNNDRISKVKKDFLREAKEQGYILNEEKEDRLDENVEQVFATFRENEALVYQELDSIDNPKAYEENDVVEIFIRANSGGTQLGKSDLLFSLLTSSWEDADEKMEALLETLNTSGYRFSRDFILKTCLSLLNKGASYEVKKFRDGHTRDAITDGWDQISEAIRDVRDYLHGHTFIRSDAAMPSYLALIPVIYFRYHFPGQWSTIEGLDDYLMRTLITGAFSGRPDTLIDRCTRHIRDSKAFDIKQLFGVIRADGRSLEVSRDTLLNLRYGSKSLHLLFNLWYRHFDYTPAYENNLPQVDHIFPQSLLKSVKDYNSETGRHSLMRYKAWERDQIANCMLLRAEENGAAGKSDMPPEAWFADKSDAYLDLHLIPKKPSLWTLDKYDEFIEVRQELIINRFEFLLQGEE